MRTRVSIRGTCLSPPRTFPALFPPHSQRGMSLIELLVVIGILGLVVAVTLPGLKSSALDLSTATQNLVGDLRIARANAASHSAHYRVTISSESYTIQRLQDNDGDGVWQPTGSPQSVDLRDGISLNVESGDGVVEFNTRGLVESDNAGPEIERITLTDSRDGKTKQVEVWPSGQVLEM